MTELSVGELLREADQHVRELTFEASSFHAEGLLTGWAAFLTSAQAVARTLPVHQTRQDLDRLARAWRWNPPAQVAADTRLATATRALEQVAALTAGRDLLGAPDLGQVAGHLSTIVCIGAHATAASIRRYLDQTLAAAQNRAGLASPIEATSSIPRLVYTRLLEQVDRAEELSLIGLAQAGRFARPLPPPPGPDRLEAVTARWAQLAQEALTAAAPSITDLRTIARVNTQLTTATRHLTRVSVEVLALTPTQEAELRPALETATRAWAAAERDWHVSMSSDPVAGSHPLTQAGIDAAQAWYTLTHQGQRWVTGREIAAGHDLGDLLELSAQHHRRASLLARDYTDASARLLAAGMVTVPTKLAAQYTGRTAATRRVPLTADYLARAGFGTGQVDIAAETARIALDTAVLHSPAATAARARLPLQMATPDLDAAIRRRVDTLTQQRAHRAARPANPAQTRTTRPPEPRTDRPEDPQPGPRLR